MKVKTTSLVLDFDLYPRGQIDSHHVREMAEAEAVGVKFPDVVADTKSKRVVDGFHRVRKQLRVYGEDATIGCRFQEFPDDASMLEAAMLANANHGRALSSYDKAHCILLADRFKLSGDRVAAALNVSIERVEEVRASKTAQARDGGVSAAVPIKRTIGHMAGKRLTAKQVETNRKLGGMRQLFYVNQLILLIESKLLDRENDKLMEALGVLKKLL